MKKSPSSSSCSSSFFFIFSIGIISLALSHISPCFCDDGHNDFKACSIFYNCGELVNISYPFWGNERNQRCGRAGFELRCEKNQTTKIQIESLEYNVLNISQYNHTMTIARSDLFDNYCPEPEYSIETAYLDNHLFYYTPIDKNISVWYHCRGGPSFLDNYTFTCGSDWINRGKASYFFDYEKPPENLIPYLKECDLNITVTITGKSVELEGGIGKNRTAVLERALKQGFDVGYEDWRLAACGGCESSGGQCGGNQTFQFFCICGKQDSHPYSCSGTAPGENKTVVKVIIGAASCVGGILLMSVLFFIWLRFYNLKHAPSFLLRSISSSNPSMEELEKGDNSMGVPLFSYKELEEATDKFNTSRELGDGGFGTVYYGKLRDGREVAVKRLFDNNYRKVEHFMNEVKILTSLRHKNLVTLYGCTSQYCHELLLVYEFIPNGTVADHVHGCREKPGGLPWCTRLKIAIETASALSYLHASNIIHRDVKTTNILLDNNFCVKVADFGLSRLSPKDATHISTIPQGTPGYVDPEYNECYQLTNKSDVFSFGVVLVELISSKPAVDITRQRREINLSTMAINKIRNNELQDFVDPCLGFEIDYRIRDMICGVAELAFRCLQSVKDSRPSMLEVLESLTDLERRHSNKGNAEEIDMSGEDDILLKGCSVPQSPNSVAETWISKSSTPNGSG